MLALFIFAPDICNFCPSIIYGEHVSVLYQRNCNWNGLEYLKYYVFSYWIYLILLQILVRKGLIWREREVGKSKYPLFWDRNLKAYIVCLQVISHTPHSRFHVWTIHECLLSWFIPSHTTHMGMQTRDRPAIDGTKHSFAVFSISKCGYGRHLWDFTFLAHSLH
jgi:hypothetical protein